ncbi:MAG: hypothetical protein ACPLRN_00630 [Microgenomates group bacterium]
MKKTLISLGLIVIISLNFNSVFAEENNGSKEVNNFPLKKFYRQEAAPTIKAIKDEVKPTISAIKEEMKDEIKRASPEAGKEVKEQLREKNKGLLEEIKNQVREKLQALKPARLTGKITEIGSNFIKVDSEGKVYQVNITEKTQLRRHFWGKSNLSEFSVGDEVNVIGRYTDETKTTIEAILIRNNSIQKRWGVFFGEVVAKNADNFVIKTINHGQLTVYFNNAKFVGNDEKPLTYADLQVGERVRVKGVWDKTLSKITEVDQVKVYHLRKLTVTPTATANPTQ